MFAADASGSGVQVSPLQHLTGQLCPCSSAAPQHINSSLSPVRGEDISLYSYQLNTSTSSKVWLFPPIRSEAHSIYLEFCFYLRKKWCYSHAKHLRLYRTLTLMMILNEAWLARSHRYLASVLINKKSLTRQRYFASLKLKKYTEL